MPEGDEELMAFELGEIFKSFTYPHYEIPCKLSIYGDSNSDN